MHDYSKNKKYGFATFIDMSKAFDRVDHFKLGHKLLENNVPVDLVYFIMHYLRNQLVKVKWKDASSSYSHLETGVRQGGIISPFLFNVYINDIINDIASTNCGCMMGITRLNILVYADDIVLLAQSITEMERLYSKLCNSIDNLKLSVNKTKTKCLCFGKKLNRTNEKLKLGNDELDLVDSYKYLGHVIERDLLDIQDITYRLTKFYASTNSILRNFKHTNPKTLLYLFNSYCKPDYGLNLWTNKLSLSRCKFKAFEVAYNNALKRIMNMPLYSSNHEVAERSEQFLLRHHIALLQAKYYHRLNHSNCFLIKINLPFLKRGHFFNHVNKLFKDVYEVDVSRHSIDILNARVSWVQKHEQRRALYIPRHIT